LIGIPFDSKFVDELKTKHYVFNELVEDERGLIGFKIDLDEETSGTYTSEEIMAMILKHAKDLAET
jgi:molecular chaperone DnaK (HSP70)